MIFLTVGTTNFTFTRLLEIVDRVLMDGCFKEQLITQVGINNYRFRYPYLKIYREVSFEDQIKYLKSARAIISHGGTGTILSAILFAHKKPLVIPREKRYQEHVDDHQVFLCHWMKRNGKVETVLPGEDIVEKINLYLKAKNNEAEPSQMTELNKLTNKLINYTDLLFK